MSTPWNPDPWNTEAIALHTQRLLDSFQHCTGKPLLSSDPASSPGASAQNLAQRLFEAPFVVVSHGIQADPIFNYGNRKALELWALSWYELTQMPSRKTAEVELQADRSQMLTEALRKGYIDNYEGIRISSTGRRFRIVGGVIWNVVDGGAPAELGKSHHWGQAATFSRYEFL